VSRVTGFDQGGGCLAHRFSVKLSFILIEFLMSNCAHGVSFSLSYTVVTVIQDRSYSGF
jgi:hypothetical protein